MMKNMKTVIIIVLVVALISAVAAGVWYFKTRFYVPDKNGMVYKEENQIIMNDENYDKGDDNLVNNS